MKIYKFCGVYMKKLFTYHPETVGETYFLHLKFAAIFGFKLMIAGIASLLHAIFPFIFAKTGSNCLFALMENYIERMPVVEDRVVLLGERIKAKIAMKKVST